jgi:hypothetical protein
MMKRLTCSSLLAGAVLLCGVTTADARLSANRLSANRLSAYSAASNNAAASTLAASQLAVEQLGPHEYAVDPAAAAGLLATQDGREVLSFIVSCALPDGVTLVATAPDGTLLEFFGELGLASEWLDHPLREAGRGWVSACLFARVNANNAALPLSLRGPNQALAATPEEAAGWSLEEGAFYGDYFVSPGEPVSWIACRGEDQALGEAGGLVERDCAEPDPADPTRTQCGFTYAGDCGDFAPEHACKHFSPRDFYRKCDDRPIGEPDSKAFREVITVFVAP